MQFVELGMGIIEIIPQRIGDSRGFFAETWQRQRFATADLDVDWIQDNQSRSAERGILRGLHAQIAPAGQRKLIRVLRGSIFDVAVDVRHSSPSYGRWVSRVLSAEAFNQLFIPAGFLHGFLTLEENVEVLYKVDAPYRPEAERAIRWDDPQLAIPWPLSEGERPSLSAKDAAAHFLADIAHELSF